MTQLPSCTCTRVRPAGCAPQPNQAAAAAVGGQPGRMASIQEGGEEEERETGAGRGQSSGAAKGGPRGDASAFLAALTATAPPPKRGKGKAAAAGGQGSGAGQGVLGAGAAGLLGLGGGSGAGAGEGLASVGLESQCAHLPHHAAGTPQHATAALASPESAELLSMLSSLVAMGLLLRVRGPRACLLAVACDIQCAQQ